MTGYVDADPGRADNVDETKTLRIAKLSQHEAKRRKSQEREAMFGQPLQRS
jgi:hypothetical protein